MKLPAKIFSGKEFEKILSFFPKKNSHAGLCCIAFQQDGIAIAHVIYGSDNIPVLEHCEFLSAPPAEHSKILMQYVKRQHLQGVACSLLLQYGEYQILHIEPPEVTTEEIVPALRWKIKDMLSFPASDAILDYFPMPDSTPAAKNGTLNVVAVNVAYLKKLVGIIRTSGLALKIIDISELALRNLLSIYPGESAGLGLIWFKPTFIELTITRQKNLYLNRVLIHSNSELAPLEISETANENNREDLVLKIQRSLDYYQSQLRQTSLSKLLTACAQPEILSYISGKLTVGKVEALDLQAILKCKPELTKIIYSNCLAVIGGALRARSK